MRRLFVAFLILLAASLIGGAVYLIREMNQTFPQMRPGFYAGVLSSNANDRVVPWSVEVNVGSADLLVSVALDSVPAQRGAIVESSSGTRLPLIISGSDRRYRITGREVDDGFYEGEYSDPITSDTGRWSLRRVDVGSLSSIDRDDLVDWAATWRSLRAVEVKIEESKQAFDSDQARMEKLRRYAVDDDSLHKEADARASLTDIAVEEFKRSNANKRAELEGLLRNIDIAKRVSAEGRLVELSRESIQREGKWIEGALQLVAPEEPESVDQEFERALRVKGLQDEIESERVAISKLTQAPKPTTAQSGETESEEAFYSGLQ